MLNWLRRLLKRERHMVYPFRPMLEAMKAKDPALYAIVGPMPVGEGLALWRQKHPEDFANG